MKKLLPYAAACAAFVSLLNVPLAAWTSTKVVYDANGRLTYPADASGNRVPDYSHAGYKGGGVALPASVPVRVTISPVAGDDTASIQAAIDQVGALPLQADGYRGAVLLSAGVYDVAGTIRINQSGVVLAGVGDGDDSASNTILRRTGTSLADVITAGGGANDQFKTEVAGTRREITTQRVTVGSRSFAVSDATGFAVGDNIVIHHPSTAAWIAAMDNGGVTDANVWQPGDIDIRYSRYITAISGSTITVDAPVFNHLDRAHSISAIYKYERAGILTNIGIEDLQIDIVTAGATSETHCEDAVQFIEAEDSWIRDCTIKHFWHAGVQFVASTRCTVERVRALEPHSVVTGGRRYNFSTYHAQLILFQDCFASYARHGFIANGTANDSGNVVLRGTLDFNITFSEGHRRWSTGILFDNLVANANRTGGDVMGFYNRGNYGTGHGWAVGHGVIWNSNAAGGKVLVQQPPTAQNYAIGCFGNVTGAGPFAGAAGFIEGANTSGLQPASLYLEQLAQRMPLATPTFSPAGGTYSSGQSVTLSTTSAGASIRYTTDGSTPSATVGTVYSGPIAINSTTTLKAIAYRTGWTSSAVATAVYTINLPPVAAPVFSPGGGSYTTAQSVTITSGTSGAAIRYTTDGSTPTSTTGTLYSGPVSIASTTTLKAIAYKAGQPDSTVTTATYTITAPGGTTITNANGFVSVALSATQSGTFTATVAASPSLSPSNSVVGLSSGAATGYTGIACMARFNTSGFIDARNGGGFTTGTVPFSAGVSYTFRFVVNVTAHTYSAYVTPAGGAEQTLGANLAFRTETASVTNLSHAVFNVNATPGGSLTYWPVTLSGTTAKLTIPGANVTASADDGNVPANTVDGSLTTRWSANGDGQWIRFDLGSTKTISLLKIAFYSGDVRTSSFEIQTSTDGTTFTTRGGVRTSSGTSLALETFDVNPDVSARYVRILGHGNSVNLWNSYTEVEVWGY